MENRDVDGQAEIPESVRVLRQQTDELRKQMEDEYAEVERSLPKISDQMLASMKDAAEVYRKMDEVYGKLPKIPQHVLDSIEAGREENIRQQEIISSINAKNVVSFPFIDRDAARERDAWARHDALLGMQKETIIALGGILDEQKAGSGMTKWILGLTAVLAVLTVILVIIELVHM